MLLSAEHPDGSPMPDVEIRDNLMSMVLAGHETTTGELTWAFQLLAHNPTVQERLIDEIDGQTGDQYLTATVHETLRHKPVFLFAIPREVMRPSQIGQWTYLPSVHLAACTYLMHHDPEFYRHPDEFRPERFIDEAPSTRTWMPWGGGRKHCLGRHFALLEVQSIIHAVLSGNRVLPVSRRMSTLAGVALSWSPTPEVAPSFAADEFEATVTPCGSTKRRHTNLSQSSDSCVYTTVGGVRA